MRPAHLQLSIVVVIVLGLLLGGCGGGDGGVATSISGTVYDDGTLTAVEGAIVAATSATDTTTDSAGYFELSNVSSGLRSITVAADGYTTQAVTVAAGSGDKSVGLVYLEPAPRSGYGSVSGTITESGTVLGGAIVRCGGQTARTKSDGTYTVYNVAAGVQAVVAASSDGSTGGTTSVTVVSLGTVTANIALTTQPPAPPDTD